MSFNFDFSSQQRTTERTNGATRSVSTLKSRRFSVRVSKEKRRGRPHIHWLSLLVTIVRVLLAVAKEGLLGSGKRLTGIYRSQNLYGLRRSTI